MRFGLTCSAIAAIGLAMASGCGNYVDEMEYLDTAMSPGAYRLLADAALILHLGFVLFVLFGGLFVLRRPWIAWIHVPTAVWGVLVEFGGWICPLTPLENSLRERSGLAPYSGDFVEYYLLMLLYPLHLTRLDQVFLGTMVFAVNGVIYWFIVRRRFIGT